MTLRNDSYPKVNLAVSSTKFLACLLDEDKVMKLASNQFGFICVRGETTEILTKISVHHDERRTNTNPRINKNRSTLSAGGFCKIYTPNRTCSELPSLLPGVDKLCTRDRRYTKGEFNQYSTIPPSMSTIILLDNICKMTNRHK